MRQEDIAQEGIVQEGFVLVDIVQGMWKWGDMVQDMMQY